MHDILRKMDSVLVLVVVGMLLEMPLVCRAIAGWRRAIAGWCGCDGNVGLLNDHLDNFVAFGDPSGFDAVILLSWGVSGSVSDSCFMLLSWGVCRCLSSGWRAGAAVGGVGNNNAALGTLGALGICWRVGWCVRVGGVCRWC